jgi:hypothetical protein
MKERTIKPEPSNFTAAEWRLIQRYRSPLQVQRFLRTLDYNREKEGETQRSFREVIRLGTAHCLEAAITAAAILEQHQYPPLLLSFESSDKLDHVIFVFKSESGWGSVGRSRDAGLHGRKPVFRSPRNLALSYFDPYVDLTGRITGYAVVDLRELTRCDWRFSPRNLWKLEKYLVEYPHRKITSSDERYKGLLNRYTAFRTQYPNKQATYYDNRHLWM